MEKPLPPRKAEARKDRLTKALKANLKRRKAQAKARKQGEPRAVHRDSE